MKLTAQSSSSPHASMHAKGYSCILPTVFTGRAQAMLARG